MSNPEYQRLLRRTPAELRADAARRRPGCRRHRRAHRRTSTTTTCVAAVRNLGGHDLAALREAFAQIDDTRPTVIIAYTLKGYGLAIEGHPQNHSALLTEDQLDELADRPRRSTRPTRGQPFDARQRARPSCCARGRRPAAPRGPR